MEVTNFLKTLGRNKIALITVPLITVIVTYFLVRKLPDTYTSTARVAAGIVDGSADLVNGNREQENFVNQEFSNVIQTIMLKKVLNQVSYQLLMHDLTSPTPFRKPAKILQTLSESQKGAVVALLKQKFATVQDLSLASKEEVLVSDILGAMRYDNGSLANSLSVYRLNKSDFIDLEFTGDNPELTAFVLNELCKDFIAYYAATSNQRNHTTVSFLDSLVRSKHAILQQKMSRLESYKVRNGILDVNDQANILIGQIADYESKKQEAEKNIGAYEGAISNIDNKFNPSDRKYFESSVTKLNQDILSTRNKLNALNAEYIKSNFDARYKSRIDSLQNLLTSEVNNVNDKYSFNPASTKQELVSQKLNLELSLQLAKNSVSSLNNELARLNSRLYKLVPDQAAIQTLEDEIKISINEYTELTKKYEQARLEESFIVGLKQIENALPGSYQPSKKMFLVILAGVISLVFCLIVLFIKFYLDNSINSSKELANRTNQPVLGALSRLPVKKLNLEELWRKTNESSEMQYFKGLLRAIRFELETASGTSSVLAITSLKAHEGKTFFALNLAYAYTMANKRVLLIDGNFEDSEITKTTNPGICFEDYILSNDDALPSLEAADNLVVFGNRGEDCSLFELRSQEEINRKLQILKKAFDVILIEVPSLHAMNKAKEWMIFADKVVPVFEFKQAISRSQDNEIEYLHSLNGKLTGWVLNKVPGITTAEINKKGRKIKTVSI